MNGVSTPAGGHQYWSVDSAPARLTRSLSPWAAPTALVVFTVVAAAMLYAVNSIEVLARNFPNHDIVFSPYSGTHSLPLRIFILSFFIAYSTVVGASIGGRIRFFFELSLYFIVLCGAFDVMNLVAYHLVGFVYSLHVVEILSGLFGFFVFSLKLLDHGSMPARAATPRSPRYKLRSVLLIALATAAAIALSVGVDAMDLPLVSDLQSVSLLGGTGPGVFLFLPALFFILYVAGTLQSLLRRTSDFAPPVTIIIPAHNEAHVIGQTLAAIDASAGRYGGSVEVLVLDNCSTDGTAQATVSALSGLSHATGRVVDVPTPGKANALNRGIAATATQFMIRIDADTQVLPDTIRFAMRHFSRADVGVVGGLPQAPGGGVFDRARNLETLLKHGYYQVAYGAVDGIVGIPGMFAAYRTDALRTAGGFVGGMNGEDTDASLRIGESGWRIVGDPSIVYISEVPRTYRHLREQRMRWFRSVYHVSARNRNYLDSWTLSARGKIILPFMLLNSGRRAMTVPLVIFGALNYLYAFNPQSTLTAQAVIAVVLGAPALMAAFAALANGRVGALIGLPEYVIFRMMRSYLTLESVLSIAFQSRKEQLPASD
ncbi:MAG TPA: glycosyltransferase family 2 protein [Pelagibacterium sp.]|uniref:glycosyltransferase n=1 Tax=Pelagibacterium sp. TaxID=1967288 RepID=UPI002CCDFE8C|nr:glycosyltransferase family 2 protein [Pelagibacterium sp.]HWJ87265.1 glycosyltransferase family 2 protein [Pelagibacterium sp.]